MKVPFLDLDRAMEPIRAELEAAALDVLRGGHFILGPNVAAFEAEFGRYLAGAEVVGVSSGTAALFVALMALDVGPGDEVITTPFTFASPVEAICRLGATPVFVDIDPQTFLLDLDAVEAAVTPRTKAILPVHLFGKCVDLARLRGLCDREGIALVEDAAQAHGARHRDAFAGTVGEFGCFSFYPTKNLGAAGDAGAIVARTPELAERARLIARHGAGPKYHHRVLGQNERLDEIQAAILRVKLPHLDRWNARRRLVAARYRERLDGVVSFPREDGGDVYHHLVVRVPAGAGSDADDGAGRGRGAVREELAARGIGTGVYYPEPLHLQPAFRDFAAPVDLPHAECACREVLALPCFPGLETAEIDAVCDALADSLR